LTLPSKHVRIARHEMMVAISHRTLQECPIHLLADHGPACDHEPSLTSVVGGKIHNYLHVRTRHELGNRCACFGVPLLPEVKASARVSLFGAARAGAACRWVPRLVVFIPPRWLVSEQLGHAFRECIPHRVGEIVLAQRLDHITMASGGFSEERQPQDPQHVLK